VSNNSEKVRVCIPLCGYRVDFEPGVHEVCSPSECSQHQRKGKPIARWGRKVTGPSRASRIAERRKERFFGGAKHQFSGLTAVVAPESACRYLLVCS
jgi:hypothetical protein